MSENTRLYPYSALGPKVLYFLSRNFQFSILNFQILAHRYVSRRRAAKSLEKSLPSTMSPCVEAKSVQNAPHQPNLITRGIRGRRSASDIPLPKIPAQ